MKKLVAILLILVLAASVTACGPKTQEVYVMTESLRTIGEAEVRTEYSYAQDGTVTEIKLYLNDQVMRTTVNRVSNGIQYVTVKDSSGTISNQAVESVYNEAGQLTLVTTIYDGMNTVTNQYTYNEAGNVSKIVTKSPDGEVVTTYTYDENGNLISQLQIDDAEDTYLRVDSVYNEESYVIKESTYSAENVLESYVEILYAKNNTEKTTTHFDGEGNPTGEVVITTYDEHGNPVKEVTPIDGEVAQTVINTYVMMEVPVKE